MCEFFGEKMAYQQDALDCLPHPLRHDLTVRLLKHVFSSARIHERVVLYTDRIYHNTYQNRKVRKAFINQLFDIMKEENAFLRRYVRVFQRKRPSVQDGTRRATDRPVRPRAPTEYIAFCRKIRQEKQPFEYAGKLQELWRAHKGLQPKVRKRYICNIWEPEDEHYGEDARQARRKQNAQVIEVLEKAATAAERRVEKREARLTHQLMTGEVSFDELMEDSSSSDDDDSQLRDMDVSDMSNGEEEEEEEEYVPLFSARD